MPRSSKSPAVPASELVQRYFDSLPQEARARLTTLQAAIKAAAPDAEDRFGYAMPGFGLNGALLVWYAAWKQHCSLYPLTPVMESALGSELAGYYTSGKGTIQFPHNAPLPVDLIQKLVGARIAELGAGVAATAKSGGPMAKDAAGDVGSQDLADRALETRRTFNAPLGQVFAAWTEPRHVDQWFGPHGLATSTHHMNFVPGGEWRFDMCAEDGTVYPNLVVYRVIDPPRRLVFDHSEPDGSNGFIVTVDFIDLGDRTEMRLRHLFATAEARNAAVEFGAIEAGSQTWSRLADYLALMNDRTE